MMKNNDKSLDSVHEDKCPGCGSTAIKTLKSPSESKVYLTDGDEMSVTFGLSGCEQCALIFLNPRMGPNKLSSYYKKQSRIPREELDQGSPFNNLMELQLDFIEKIKPIHTVRAALEIGCAEGFFLRNLQARGKDEILLYGVELSDVYVQQAKVNLKNQAVILDTSIENAEFEEVKFDLIIIRHVFEHLADPVGMLKKIKILLSPNGVVYIEVPDSEDIKLTISNFYHHEHLLYFTPLSLSLMLSRSGFQSYCCERFEGNPVNSGFSYPVIRSLSTISDSTHPQIPAGHASYVYNKNKLRLKDYHNSLLINIRERLKRLNKNEKRIAIFGAGPHTVDFLELLKSDNIRFEKIFDNNQNKQGKSLRGIPIVRPDNNTLKSVDCVLISSAEFEKEMITQVRALVGNCVDIIAIYGNDNGH